MVGWVYLAVQVRVESRWEGGASGMIPQTLHGTGIVTYIDPIHDPNVGNYSMHPTLIVTGNRTAMTSWMTSWMVMP